MNSDSRAAGTLVLVGPRTVLQPIRTFVVAPARSPGVLPIINSNQNRGEGYGVELAADLDVTSNWELSGYYAFLQLQIHSDSVANDIGSGGKAIEGV